MGRQPVGVGGRISEGVAMNASELTRLHIIQHALGRDQYGMLPRHIREEYRNRYVIGPDCNEYDVCLAMVNDGLMTRHPGGKHFGGMDFFVVTDDGRKFMADNSQKKKKPTRSQQLRNL